MTTQHTGAAELPQALRLAEILEGDYCPDWFYEQGVDEVAAELRRLHAENEALRAQPAGAPRIPVANLIELHQGLADNLHDGPARNLHLATVEALRTQPAGAATPAAPHVPSWLQYDQHTDVLTIHGKRYAAGMFGESGFLAPTGTLLRVELGQPDCLTLSKVAEGEPAVTAGTVDALCDSQYAAGMLLGWNLCTAGDDESFRKIREQRMTAALAAQRVTHQGDHK